MILSAAVLFLSSNVFASGGYSSGGYSGGGYSSPAPKVIDQAYEYGKSLYRGRLNGQKASYCIMKDNVSTPVRRSSIRKAKGLSYAQLGALVHNCSDAQQTLSSIFNKNQLNAVAYYLNKRYKLNLQRS